jgi:hypothetical protein
LVVLDEDATHLLRDLDRGRHHAGKSDGRSGESCGCSCCGSQECHLSTVAIMYAWQRFSTYKSITEDVKGSLLRFGCNGKVKRSAITSSPLGPLLQVAMMVISRQEILIQRWIQLVKLLVRCLFLRGGPHWSFWEAEARYLPYGLLILASRRVCRIVLRPG